MERAGWSKPGAGMWIAGLCIGLAPLVELPAQALEEITVTARRKQENLQEVPLSVSVIGDEELKNRGITELSQLVALDPSVVIDQGFSAEDNRIAIRGLTNTRGRSNVAFLVDGVDVTSESIASAGSSLLVNQRLLGDIERVEIIKGPQSALYGRSAFAGAISYVTRNANLEALDWNAGLELNDNNLFQLSGGVSGPIIPGKLGARLQAITWDEDSFYDNFASGNNLGGSDGYGTALTFNWEPTDTLDIKWRTSYSDSEDAPPPQVIYGQDEQVQFNIPVQAFESNGGPVADDSEVFGLRSIGDAKGRKVTFSEEPIRGGEYPGSESQILRSTLNINWEVGPGVFTSITGGTDADLFIQQDIDYQAEGRPDTIINNWELDTKNRTTQISQEFRYATAFDGPFNFTGGVLGWRERRDAEYRGYIAVCQNFTAITPCAEENWQGLVRLYNPQYGDNGFADAETRHWSLYGLVEWDATDRLAISLEARYVNEYFETKVTQGTQCRLTPFGGCLPEENFPVAEGSVRSDFITPKILAEYSLSDTALIYASVAKGQKPGGITTLNSGVIQPIESLTFDPEKLWAYEVGWKTSFDGRFGSLIFNGAVFYQDYTDKQVLVRKIGLLPNPSPPPEFIETTAPATENASSAEVWGQEVQLVWQTPFEPLSFNIGYTHLATEYDDYKSLSQAATTIADAGNCRQVTIGTEVFCEVDYSGNELERSPEHNLVTTTRYLQPIGAADLELLAELDVNYQSERFTAAGNQTEFDDVWLSNIRLGVQTENWSVIGYVNNVFDNDTILSGGVGTPDFGAGFKIPPTIQTSSILPDPRVIGVRFNYRYGQ